MKPIISFWQKCPALFYALAILLGCFSAFNFSLCLVIPAIFLWAPLVIANHKVLRGRLFLSILSTSSAFFYVTLFHSPPALPDNGLEGTAHLEIVSVSKSNSFGKQWQFKGNIKNFTPKLIGEKNNFQNIPFLMNLPANSSINRPVANCDYLAQGIIKQNPKGTYVFHCHKQHPWYPIKGTLSFAESRYHAKKTVKTYISNHFSDSKVATFLSGIATGEFDNKIMIFEFGRFGLQHVMAISGFHFSIIASIVGLFLQLLFPRGIASMILISILSSYFVFLGNSPSILRAWIMIVIPLSGIFLERKSSGLNSLGVAMIITLMADPLMCENIGFQFSFLITAAILLLYSAIEPIVLAKRSLGEMVQMTRIDQHFYLILTLFKRAIALSIAVNVIAMPLTLYYWGKFPLMGLVYNIFFPFMVSISMCLLILGIGIGMISSFLGSMVHSLNSHFTKFMLNLAYNLPTAFDFYLRSSIPTEVLVFLISCLFVLALYLRHYWGIRNMELKELTIF